MARLHRDTLAHVENEVVSALRIIKKGRNLNLVVPETTFKSFMTMMELLHNHC